jgi:hypothetical protein
MAKQPPKKSGPQAQYESAGADVLSDYVRGEMHAKVATLREKLAAAREASERAAKAYDQVRRLTMGNARSWRMKAEELRTVADQTGSPKAADVYRQLARSYDVMAERAEAATRTNAETDVTGTG